MATPRTRTFNGTDGGSGDQIRFNGTFNALANGPYSILCLMRSASAPTPSDECYVSIGTGTSTVEGSLYSSGPNPDKLGNAGTSTGDCQANMNVTHTGDWQLIGVTKATGTIEAKFHRRQLGSGSWTHTVGFGALANDATSITDVFVGRFNDNSSLYFRAMDLCWMALFATELSDGAIETIETAAVSSAIVSAGAQNLYEFGQTSTAVAVEDLVGTCDQSAITGTTVSTTNQPNWTYLADEVTWPPPGADNADQSLMTVTGSRMR